MSARAQVSYLRDEKNVSFELMGEEDTVAFLEERSFFFKLKAFAKDFEKYSCKPGEKGRYVNLDFGHLVELSKLDKTLRSLVLDPALDIEHYLKVRINAAAMRAGTDPFKVVDTFLVGSAASVVSEQTKALDKSAGASAIRLATSTLERCDLESRPVIVSAANEATVALSKVTNGRDPRHVEHAIVGMVGSPYSGALVRKYADGPIPLWTLLELVSLGTLTRLYRHCFGRAGTIDDPEERSMLSSYRGMLRCTQQLRNAAAHNDCLLNGLASHEKKSGAYPKIRRALVEDYGMDPDVVAQVGSVRVAMDLAAVLICYDAYVPRGGSRSRARPWRGTDFRSVWMRPSRSRWRRLLSEYLAAALRGMHALDGWACLLDRYRNRSLLRLPSSGLSMSLGLQARRSLGDCYHGRWPPTYAHGTERRLNVHNASVYCFGTAARRRTLAFRESFACGRRAQPGAFRHRRSRPQVLDA